MSWFLSKFCIPLQFHERLLLCTFLAERIYTFLKTSPLKWKFLRRSSALVKFCQIPYANFQTTSRFLSKFCVPLQFHEKLLLCTFLAQTICTLLIRSPLKWKSFETFECSGQILPNSLRQFWKDESIPLQILYPSSISRKKTLPYFFSSNNIYFSQNEPIKVKILETFECSGQILSNSLRQFWNK